MTHHPIHPRVILSRGRPDALGALCARYGVDGATVAAPDEHAARIARLRLRVAAEEMGMVCVFSVDPPKTTD
jgi:hypothetical protein